MKNVPSSLVSDTYHTKEDGQSRSYPRYRLMHKSCFFHYNEDASYAELKVFWTIESIFY